MSPSRVEASHEGGTASVQFYAIPPVDCGDTAARVACVATQQYVKVANQNESGEASHDAAALAIRPTIAAAPVSWAWSARLAAGLGGTGSTSVPRRARLRSRSGTRFRNCWHASGRAGRRGRRGRGVPRSNGAAIDAGSAHRHRHGAGRAADRRRHDQGRAGRDLRRLRRRRRHRLGAAGALRAARRHRPIVHIPDRIFEGYGPNVEAIRALARAARRCSSPSTAAPPASSRSPKRGGSAST